MHQFTHGLLFTNRLAVVGHSPKIGHTSGMQYSYVSSRLPETSDLKAFLKLEHHFQGVQNDQKEALLTQTTVGCARGAPQQLQLQLPQRQLQLQHQLQR